MDALKAVASEIATRALRPVRGCATDEQYRDAHDHITTALESFRKSPVMHRVALTIWQAWMELNEIRARDGVPYTHLGGKASVDENYFSRVVDDCENTYKLVTGKQIAPWAPLPDSFADDDRTAAKIER